MWRTNPRKTRLSSPSSPSPSPPESPSSDDREEEHLPLPKRRRYCICIISDFCYPRLGGVELHQYHLAQGLIRRGHKVIMITTTYGARQGVRYMTNGLKVYYCPEMPFIKGLALPVLFTFFPLFRHIAIREGIEIVHGHQTTATLAHNCIMYARTMGIKAIFTDHSLFGFSDGGAIHLNKLMKFSLSHANHVICVSHCSRENLVLRACLDPSNVSVIPNAVDATKFMPDPTQAPDPNQKVNIVIVSRLVYRKGVDLVVRVIPEICRRFPQVHWIIGGDGNKRILIEEMREKHQLQDRVEVLGAIPHSEVRNVLVRGHLFLNCSLTEAFCIAILEAVSSGLFVVSTAVGGVPEILPDHMIRFAQPNPEDIIEKLSDAIPLVKDVKPNDLHNQIKEMYNWHDVAARTEKVYDEVIKMEDGSFIDTLQKYYSCGLWAGKIFCCVVSFNYLLWRFLNWAQPKDDIERAIDFPAYEEIKDKL